MTGKSTSTRFHELDALRAVAMLLGMVLHSLLFLMPDPLDLWPVQDLWAIEIAPERNLYIHVFLLIHGFRMPVFFMLSGFFTAMLWQRRGLWPLAQHRLKRIGIPLVLCTLTVIPVCAFLYRTLEADNFGEFNLISWPVLWLDPRTGFFHTWFLWQLMLLGAVFVIAARLGVRFVSPVWWLVIPLSGVSMFFMSETTFGPDSSLVLIPDLNVLGFYALFFFFGVFFYQRQITVRRWWGFALIPALMAYLVGIFFILSEIGSVGWAVTALFQAIFAWLMCFGMMGLFNLIASKERFWLRYMSDSSYWLYLWHLPLVVVLQYLLIDVGMSVHLKFVLICVGVTAITLVTYHLGVRYTWIGTMLNGKRTRPAPAGS